MRGPQLFWLLRVTTLLAVALRMRWARAEMDEGVIPSALLLDDALALFRKHGFDLIIADAQIDSASGDVTAAGVGRTVWFSPLDFLDKVAPEWAIQGGYSGNSRNRRPRMDGERGSMNGFLGALTNAAALRT